MGIKEKCKICGCMDSQINYDLKTNYLYFGCPLCGNYVLPANSPYILFNGDNAIKDERNRLACYLLYNKNDKYKFLGEQTQFNEFIKEIPLSPDRFILTDSQVVENWYPKTFNEKVDKILLAFGARSKYFGAPVEYTSFELYPLLFMKNWHIEGTTENAATGLELEFLLDYFVKNEYIVGYPDGIDLFEVADRIFDLPNDEELNLPMFVLSAKAWDRIYELQKNQMNNKKIFIAISFNPAIEKTYNAIDLAIKQAKCEVVSMKHRIHNKQIVPEMLRLIKESKMLVMDISEPNFGAYYEAGYAQGLDKEVIITCKSSVMKKDEFLCDDKKGAECELLRKYSKPHFDIAQKQILVWEDEADLTEQLTEWIKFLIG